MPRKRPLFGPAQAQGNVLPRFVSDLRPEFSASERAAWRKIKPHLHRFVQRRRGLIGSAVGAGAIAATEYTRQFISDYFPKTKKARRETPLDIKATSVTPTPTPQPEMPGGTPMQIAPPTHGDGADGVDPAFGRDAEDPKAQEGMASALWVRAPRIYDDEIIVRLPLLINYDANASPFTNTSRLDFQVSDATAGPPIVPACGLLNIARIQLNNIFTPYTDDTAQKPRGYAWYSQLYNYYQVLECRWTYTVHAITIATTNQTNTANQLESNPYIFWSQMTDNTHTSFASERAVMELASTNGADKSIILTHPKRVAWWGGMDPTLVSRSAVFSGHWTPARFDDLQLDITRNPMTAIAANPNWINYLDLGAINWNTAWEGGQKPVFELQVHCEFLVHFKKINMTKYATAN